MDERKQYVPAARTYPAEENKIGIKPESIVIEAAKKKTNYKNVTEIPVETTAAMVNNNNSEH